MWCVWCQLVAKALEICDKLRVAEATLEAATFQCMLLSSQGRWKDALAVAEQFTSARPTSPRAWLLLADLTQGSQCLDGDAYKPALASQLLALLERAIRSCAATHALSDDSDVKAEFELLHRRRLDVRLSSTAGDNSKAIDDDFKVSCGGDVVAVALPSSSSSSDCHVLWQSLCTGGDQVRHAAS